MSNFGTTSQMHAAQLYTDLLLHVVQFASKSNTD